MLVFAQKSTKINIGNSEICLQRRSYRNIEGGKTKKILFFVKKISEILQEHKDDKI